MLRPLLVHVVVSEKRAPSRGFQDTVYWLWSFNLAENDNQLPSKIDQQPVAISSVEAITFVVSPEPKSGTDLTHSI